MRDFSASARMSLRNVRILLLVLIALEAALLIFGPQAGDHLPAIEAALTAKARPPWWDDAAMGVRYAAWINLGLLLLLLGTSQWWTRPSTAPQISNLKSQISNPKWFWPLAITAVIICLGLRLPLAGKSLWWDEAWVVMQASHGKWNADSKKPGELKFQAHDWKRCAFYYQKPTNHVPMSLAQKASLTIWHKFSGAPPGDFSDLAVRTPALIASCAAVLLLALLLRSWGWAGAGTAAAFLLALHPWYVRYGVDARAYALVVPLCIAGIFAVSRVWQSRGAALLPWVCWGLIEFLWLWAYPNAVIDVAALNLLLALVFLCDKEARVSGLFRLAATNLFAAMAYLQVFLPNVMQALRWAGGENVAQPLNLDLIKSTLSHLFLGVEFVWARTSETEGLVSSAAGMHGTSFAGAMIVLAAAVVVLVFTRRLSTDRLASRHLLVLATPVVSSLLFTALVSFTGSYFYQRFIIAMLPCVLALMAILFSEALADRRPLAPQARWRLRTRRSLACLLLIFLLLRVTPFWAAQDRLLLERPYAPLRDVTKLARAVAKDTSPTRKGGILVCYGHGHEVMPLYLPKMQPALSRAELEKFIAQARAEQQPLLVVQGHSVHNRALIPDGFTLLDDRNVFEELKAFPGIEPEFYFRLFRLK
jgi:hypothetical protein